jgi:hypothetical protein
VSAVVKLKFSALSVILVLSLSACSVTKSDESICQEYSDSLSQYFYDYGFGTPDPWRHINLLGDLADEASGELNAALLKDQGAVPFSGFDLPEEQYTAKACEAMGFYTAD